MHRSSLKASNFMLYEDGLIGISILHENQTFLKEINLNDFINNDVFIMKSEESLLQKPTHFIDYDLEKNNLPMGWDLDFSY